MGTRSRRSRSKKSNRKTRTKVQTKVVPEYPYKRTFLNYDTIKDAARTYEPVILTTNKKYSLSSAHKDLLFMILRNHKDLDRFNSHIYLLITDPSNKYTNYKINELTDNYSEECRVRCRVESEPFSPYDSYRLFYEENVKAAIQKYGSDGPEAMNQYMERHGYKSRMCTNYKLTYLLGLMKIFKPRRWLDLSAGWGDRLLAAILGGVDYYCGIDPNDCLHPCYKKIIEDLVPVERRNNFKLINAEAQKLPEDFVAKTFDFIFTSPPFFTFEEYEGERANREIYGSMDKWLTDFMFKTVDLAWTKLEKGGKYGLYIEDKPEYRFMDRLLEYISRQKGAHYLGIIHQCYMMAAKDSKGYKFAIRKVYFFEKKL